MIRAHNDGLEVNVDSIVGPTHFFGGLGSGNLASQQNRHRSSNPRAAALEGLEKMKQLMDLGIPQAVLPPQPRPYVSLLRRLGFSGSDAKILDTAHQKSPSMLEAAYSASAMWTANAATITPSSDSSDGYVHITTANLSSNLHRSLEAETTSKYLRCLMPNRSIFKHHPPLPAPLADEGAANHCRIGNLSKSGLHLFIYGRQIREQKFQSAFHPRHCREASEAIARRHKISDEYTLYFRQKKQAIQSGVFHFDVSGVAHEEILFVHEDAFELDSAFRQIRSRAKHLKIDLNLVVVSRKILSLKEAVKSYIFNSQIITFPDGNRALIAPEDCQYSPASLRTIEQLRSATGLQRVLFVPVFESMRNGGGPACLRLRIPLKQMEFKALNPSLLLNPALYHSLKKCIQRHYRDRLTQEDLCDPQLQIEANQTLRALLTILNVSSLG